MKIIELDLNFEHCDYVYLRTLVEIERYIQSAIDAILEHAHNGKNGLQVGDRIPHLNELMKLKDELPEKILRGRLKGKFDGEN